MTDKQFGSVRRVYVHCGEDRAITLDQQRTMCERHGCDDELTLAASHSPFLSIPSETAIALERAATDR